MSATLSVGDNPHRREDVVPGFTPGISLLLLQASSGYLLRPIKKNPTSIQKNTSVLKSNLCQEVILHKDLVGVGWKTCDYF